MKPFMWMFFFAGIFLLAGGSFLYIAWKIGACPFARARFSGKWKSFAAGAAALALVCGALWPLLGEVNLVIVLLHVAFFLLLGGAAARFCRRQGRKGLPPCLFSGAALAAVVLYLGYGWYSAHHVEETHYTIETDKAVGRLRLVLFADSHVGATFDGAGFEEQMERISALSPDAVLLAGDFVDDDTTKDNMTASAKALGELKTKYGVYYVYGNHDKGYRPPSYRGYSGEDLAAELVKNGVHVLEDETALAGGRFYIAGRADLSEEERYGRKRASAADLLSQRDPDKFTVLMDHQPRDYAGEAGTGADLVVSGHTHGGQIIPLTWLMERGLGGNDRTYGHERRNGTDFIVTSGISDWAVKFKTGCKAEYVVIDILGKEPGGAV